MYYLTSIASNYTCIHILPSINYLSSSFDIINYLLSIHEYNLNNFFAYLATLSMMNIARNLYRKEVALLILVHIVFMIFYPLFLNL